MKIGCEGIVIWITGLSGSGKSTIGKNLYVKLKKLQCNTVFIDGDTIRDICSNDLGYDIDSRLKNAYRITKLCHFLANQGMNVICSTISLFKEIQDYNKTIQTNFIEVLIEVDMPILHKRNQKNLYSTDKDGHLDSFVVGLNQNFHLPTSPNLIIKNKEKEDIKKNVELILDLLTKKQEAIKNVKVYN